MCHYSSPERVCRAACTGAEAPKTQIAHPSLQKSWPHPREAWKRCAGSVPELLQELDHDTQLCDSTVKHSYTSPLPFCALVRDKHRVLYSGTGSAPPRKAPVTARASHWVPCHRSRFLPRTSTHGFGRDVCVREAPVLAHDGDVAVDIDGQRVSGQHRDPAGTPVSAAGLGAARGRGRGQRGTYPLSPLLMNFCTSFTPRRSCLCLVAAREPQREGLSENRSVRGRTAPPP